MREQWLDAGLALLAQRGEAALTIQELCAVVGLTKGSFYHHFRGRRDFAESLLAHWERQKTRVIIETAEAVTDPLARFERLGELTMDEELTETDAAIRQWALSNPVARKYQDRVDQLRLAYLQRVFLPFAAEDERARTWAQVTLAAFVGAQQLFPAERAVLLRALVRHLLRGREDA